MHQALYRKYRPMCFDDVVGQEHVTKTLRVQSQTDRLSHAYLFCGPRGTGKTTCARILAKAANCLNPHNGDPCNECEACRAINEGSATDVFEMDAATYTGVDDIRSLRAEAVYSPSSLKKKVYIIDEVHMLSVSAFNAFLKILEEPPEHVMFILASTELQKIPATILSRCQRFEFARITKENISQRLLKIAELENIPLDMGGAALIASMADGAMRNALSLLEQAAAQGAERLNVKAVSRALGMASSGDLFGVFSGILNGDASSAVSAFEKAYAEGAEPDAFFDQLLCLSRDVLMTGAGIKGQLTGAGYAVEDLGEFLTASKEQLLFIAKTVGESLWSLSKSANKRVDAEMAIYSACIPAVSGNPSALAARIAVLEKRLEDGNFTAPVHSRKTEKPKPAEEEVPEPPKPAEAPVEAAKPAVPVEEERFLLSDQLVSRVTGELDPIEGPALSHCTFIRRGNKLVLSTKEEFVKTWIDKPEVREKVLAAAVTLDPEIAEVIVEYVKKPLISSAPKTENRNFDDLCSYVDQNPEIAHFK